MLLFQLFRRTSFCKLLLWVPAQSHTRQCNTPRRHGRLQWGILHRAAFLAPVVSMLLHLPRFDRYLARRWIVACNLSFIPVGKTIKWSKSHGWCASGFEPTSAKFFKHLQVTSCFLKIFYQSLSIEFIDLLRTKGEVRLCDLLATCDSSRCPNLILLINLKIQPQ